jgi:NAD(P)-dependent dehydrogenase (short-subunit alcohol dehydrogenase family)
MDRRHFEASPAPRAGSAGHRSPVTIAGSPRAEKELVMSTRASRLVPRPRTIDDVPRTELAGSVALVTGGGRGIGRLVSQALADVGMAVGLVARSQDELAESVALIEAAGGVAASATADISDDRAVSRAVTKLRHELGPVDLLINNAGIVGPVGPTWEIEPDGWWRTVEINLRGTLLCTQLVLPEMVGRRHGRIVNISSHAGVFRWPLVSAYSVSKAAVVKLTENLARETYRHGISVFSVHPGLLPIGLAEAAIADSSPPDSHEARVHAWIRRQFADGRGADPAEAVELIVGLASGRYDELSGRQLSVHDDVDAVLVHVDDVRDNELYVLGVPKLPAAAEQPGRHRRPGYAGPVTVKSA